MTYEELFNAMQESTRAGVMVVSPKKDDYRCFFDTKDHYQAMQLLGAAMARLALRMELELGVAAHKNIIAMKHVTLAMCNLAKKDGTYAKMKAEKGYTG